MKKMDYLLDFNTHFFLDDHLHRHFLYYCPRRHFNYLLDDEFYRHFFNYSLLY